MATLEEQRQFFALKDSVPHTMSMDGKALKLANIPKVERDKILKRLAEKDEVMARGLSGELPGIKIDGKQVTRDNIKDFEKKSEVVKEKVVKKKSKKKK